MNKLHAVLFASFLSITSLQCADDVQKPPHLHYEEIEAFLYTEFSELRSLYCELYALKNELGRLSKKDEELRAIITLGKKGDCFLSEYAKNYLSKTFDKILALRKNKKAIEKKERELTNQICDFQVKHDVEIKLKEFQLARAQKYYTLDCFFTLF